MKPPPPMLPAEGWVTASANATATAASMALPPLFSTWRPTWLASGSALATAPCTPTATPARPLDFGSARGARCPARALAVAAGSGLDGGAGTAAHATLRQHAKSRPVARCQNQEDGCMCSDYRESPLVEQVRPTEANRAMNEMSERRVDDPGRRPMRAA